MVTNMGRGVFLLGQPRYCICTNASRDLSAIAAFLVTNIRPILLKIEKDFAAVKVLISGTSHNEYSKLEVL